MRYGLEQDMEWKTEWKMMGKWNGVPNGNKYGIGNKIKTQCHMKKGMKWSIM